MLSKSVGESQHQLCAFGRRGLPHWPASKAARAADAAASMLTAVPSAALPKRLTG
jgi:hypothetical protein